MEAALNLEAMTLPLLKALLKEKGLPVSGCKAEIIKTLMSPPTGPKPKPWQHSDAHKTLYKAFMGTPMFGTTRVILA